jgi:O-antigen/teichoic acid export membrane protein
MMSDSSDIASKSILGTLVVMGVTGLRFAAGFGLQFVLARMLLPEHFGIMAFSWMVVGFLSNLTSFQTSKFVISTRENVERIVNSAFTLELLLSLGMFVLTLVLAPWAMKVLGKPDQATFVRVLALSFFSSPFLQLRALLERQLDFKKANVPDVSGLIAEAVVAISLACVGLGVWSLVWGRLSRFLVQTLVIWKITPYRPRLVLDLGAIKQVMKYGWPLVGAAVLIFFYWNIDYYIVGNLMGDEQLGYYWLAFQMSTYLLQVKNAVSTVVFPVFSALSDDERIREGFELLTKFTALAYLLPAAMMLVTGRQVVQFLLGEKWLPATIPLQVFFLLTAFKATIGYWEPIVLVKGVTRIQFYLTMYGAVSTAVLGYLFTLRWGITGMAVAVSLAAVIPMPVLEFMVRRWIGASYRTVLMPLLIFCATVVLGCVWRRYVGVYSVSGLLGVVLVQSCLYVGLVAWREQADIRRVLSILAKEHYRIVT